MGGESRGRERSSGRSFRARSRSRSRKTKTGDDKPIGSRIKGLLKGMSRRKKNMDGSSVTDGASTAVSIQQNDENKNQNVAPVSTAPPVPAIAETKPEPTKIQSASLQLVLLLMDPATRRFELLQLEFDSDKARVADIIAQIPVSVTEPAIRQQEYEGVLDEGAKKMDENVRLVDFCEGKKVLVALPKGLPVKECTRLARPILCDVQVVKMLRGSDFDVSGWEKKEVTIEEPEAQNRAIPLAEKPDIAKTADQKESSGPGIFPVIAFFALVAIVLQAVHNFVAAPIEAGVPVPPGTWKSKCGLMGYLPPMDFLPKCENLFFEVNEDGTAVVYDDDHTVEILMAGSVCSSEDCVEGLLINADKSITIGGKVVKVASVYGSDASVSPWPFEEQPKLKIKSVNSPILSEK